MEVTTLNQRLVTKKNGKVRRMGQLYPGCPGHHPLSEGHPCPSGQVRAGRREQRALVCGPHSLSARPDILSAWERPRRHSTSRGTGTEPLRHTALIDAHRRLGAQLVPFGGWEMPLSYGDGTLAEHRACRTDSVMFDVSHLGTVRVEGDGAFDRLQSALSNDLRRVAPGRAQYTHLLDDDDGSVVDDIIVWWLDDGAFDVMPNASNTARVVAAVGGEDTTDSRCIIAVQGPHARPGWPLWPPKPPPCPVSG